ncbi:MAG: hypothetical protein Q8K82_04510 [Gemmatimonadaceae bacterium]|nr:hypothetical protein [Gemmatimonadaceae bacterium]
MMRRRRDRRLSTDAGLRLATVAALAVALLTSCRGSTEPLALPPGSFQFQPEPVFRAWWAQMEACSGRKASFDAVTWYAIPGDTPFRVPGHDYDVVGYWDPADNRIVLLQFLPDRRASYIRHEALHAIIRRVDHPDEYFVRRCLRVIHGPENPDDSGP